MNSNQNNLAIAGGCLGAVALAVALFGLMVAVFMWAWNIFMAPVFGLPTIGWVEALGAVALLSIVGSFLSSISSKGS